MQKPPLNFWQIWNMSFGFLGIQFGWSLQMGHMSAIYEYLGAKPDQIPMLWLAAPLTGLIVQPIIGSMSDRTWGPLGRRRPYFLAGALLSTLALVLMPRCTSLWMAAGLLWVLDASINISMEPFRAFVADKLPESQRPRGFAMQSVFIGLGSVVAFLLPDILTYCFHFPETAPAKGVIPPVVRYSFYLGAVAFLGAVLWTVFTTKEYPPDDPDEFRRMKAKRSGVAAGAREIFDAVREMPTTMRRLAAVQFCTWLGLFCMWLYFIPAVAHNVFHATDEVSVLYTQGAAWGNDLFAFYSAVAFFAGFAIAVASRRTGPKVIHTLCLLCGAAGLLSVAVIHNKFLLLASMTGVGIAWASILSMPFVLLANALPPERTGVYMGIFNFFVVLPEILAALGFGWVMRNLLGNDRVLAVVVGGGFLLVAAILMQTVPNNVEPITVRADEGVVESDASEVVVPA